MFYASELSFLRKILQKFHLQAEILSLSAPLPKHLDMGLRTVIGWESDYENLFRTIVGRISSPSIYRGSDALRCHYVLIPLPGTESPATLLIGPYLKSMPNPQQLLEDAERLGVPPSRFRQMEQCYGNIPLLADDSLLFPLLNVFGETLWGSAEAFQILDIDQELGSFTEPLSPPGEPVSSEDVMLSMKLMEQRYSYENELMHIVSRGMIHRADHMLASFSQMNFEQRMGDSIRNLKNYSIICNTLLRKAAEQGGVHPIYLDRTSSSFARKIEAVGSIAEGEMLMGEMLRSYCRLVRKYSFSQYSPLVQRTIACIDADISADLSLRALAAQQKLSPAYLSAQFKKQTGQTLTEYVNEKRVHFASHLLKTTHLQIQSIALHCGIQDPNYFVRLFKKSTGLTPTEFRRQFAATIRESSR